MGMWKLSVVKKDMRGDVPIGSEDLQEIAELISKGYTEGIVVEDER